MPSLSLTSVDTETELVSEATADELLPVLLPEWGEAVTLSYDDIRVTTDGDVRVVPAEDPPGGDTTGCSGDALSTENHTSLTWSVSQLDANAGPTTAQAYLDPFYIRPASAPLRTRLVVSGTPTGLAWDHLHAYAIDCGGVRLLTGTSISDGVFEFSPASTTSVCGFELELDTDTDTDTTATLGSLIVKHDCTGAGWNEAEHHTPDDGNLLTIGQTYAVWMQAALLSDTYGWKSDEWIGEVLYSYPSTEFAFDLANGTSFSGRMGVHEVLIGYPFGQPPVEQTAYTTLPSGASLGNLTNQGNWPPGGPDAPVTWNGDFNQKVGSIVYFTATATKIDVVPYYLPNGGASGGVAMWAIWYNATVAQNRTLDLDGGGGSTVDNVCTYQTGQIDMEVRTVGLLTESVIPAYIVVSPEEL